MNRSAIKSSGTAAINLKKKKSSDAFSKPLFPLRSVRSGEEAQLVETFIKSINIPIQKGCRQTLIREPSLISGYPDLVAIQWNEATAANWNSERKTLNTNDIRLAQLLYGSKSLDESTIEKLSGSKFRRSLNRLEEVGIARMKDERWAIRNLRSIFSVRKIIAFEAKLEANTKVLEQAAINKWFASMSYILLPHLPNAGFREKAVSLGLGIWVANQKSPFIRAPLTNNQPASYASWLFNEYVCSIAMKEKDANK